MIKKYLLVVMLLSSAQSMAQKVNISVASGYMVGDKFDSFYKNDSYYFSKVSDGLQVGAGVEYVMPTNYSIDFNYFFQGTTAPTTFSIDSLRAFADFDLVLHNIVFGFNKHLASDNGLYDVYGGITTGILIAAISEEASSYDASSVNFTWGAKAGCNLFLSPVVGLKLQTQLITAVQAMGGELYFDEAGKLTGLKTKSNLYQFSVLGGIVFKLGKQSQN